MRQGHTAWFVIQKARQKARQQARIQSVSAERDDLLLVMAEVLQLLAEQAGFVDTADKVRRQRDLAKETATSTWKDAAQAAYLERDEKLENAYTLSSSKALSGTGKGNGK